MPTPSEMKREVDRLISRGEMPSLDSLLDAVHDARQKYAPEIKKARKEGQDGK